MKTNFITKIGLTYKNTVLTLWIVMILASAFMIAYHIYSSASPIDNSVGIWFMKDDAAMKYYEQYNKAFGNQEWTILLLETNSIYDPVFLKDMSDITTQIEKLDYVFKVNSITNIRDNEILMDDSLNYTKIYPVEDKRRIISSDQIKIFKAKLNRNPIFHNSIFKHNDSKHTVLLIQNANLIYQQKPYRIELVDSIKDILHNYNSITSYSLAGTTVVNAELNRASLRDVYVFYTLITILLFLFASISLRNLKDVIIMFSIVIGTIIPTMGLISAFRIPFNMISVMMPTILIALSVADVIHIINEFHDNHMKYNTEEAIQETINKLWKPTFLTSFTTVIGFASLSVSTVYPIFQLGIFAAFGISLAWVTSILIAPQLLVRFWSKDRIIKGSVVDAKHIYVYNIRNFTYKNKVAIIIVFILLFIPCLGLAFIDVDTNYTKFFAPSTNVTMAYNNIKKAGFAQNPIAIMISFPEGKKYGSDGFLEPILHFENEIKHIPEVIKMLSLSNLLREVDKAYNGPLGAEKRFATYNQSQISQLMFLAELSGNNDIEDFLSKDRTKIQILALTPYLSSKELNRFKKQIAFLGKKLLPDNINVTVTGTTVLWSNMDKQITKTQIMSLMIIGLIMICFFPIVFHSFKVGFLSVILNFLPICFTLGIMSYMDIKVNIATILIGGISLGIVVDDTIHVIYRVILENKNGETWQNSVDNAVVLVGHSIIMTSAILVAGFLCMATSNFLPTAHFGIFISISIIVALFLDIFILPIFLRLNWFVPKKMLKSSI